MGEQLVVVGGAYGEYCAEPSWAEVIGSGVRACSVISQFCETHLHTCLEPGGRKRVQLVADAFGFGITAHGRKLAIAFNYWTPLSSPVIDGTGQDITEFNVEGAAVLAFGMLEASPRIRCETLVYDPQRPRGLSRIDRDRLNFERLAVVCNEGEAMQLTLANNVAEAGPALLTILNAKAVVIKRGPLGAIVFEPGSAQAVGPFRTGAAWTIGAGDVFSAAFAWAWAVDGRSLYDAARFASGATACYAQTRECLLPTAIQGGHRWVSLDGPELRPAGEPIPVYLAGPFFNMAQRWLISQARSSLSTHGATVFSPLHDVGCGGDEVAKRDVAGLNASKSVLALLDGADAGTIFEVGYAAARGIPVVGFADDPGHEDFKMIRGTATHITSDLTSAVYNAIWAGMELA